jgi:hypothetical protein
MRQGASVTEMDTVSLTSIRRPAAFHDHAGTDHQGGRIGGEKEDGPNQVFSVAGTTQLDLGLHTRFKV